MSRRAHSLSNMASLFGKLKRTVAGDDEEKAAAPPKKQKTEAKPKPAGGQGRRLGDLRKLRGKAAILFTCPTRMERKACHEAWELLSEAVDGEQSSSPRNRWQRPEGRGPGVQGVKVATYDRRAAAPAGRPPTASMWWTSRLLLVRDASDDPASLAAGRGWSYASCRCSLLRLLR